LILCCDLLDIVSSIVSYSSPQYIIFVSLGGYSFKCISVLQLGLAVFVLIMFSRNHVIYQCASGGSSPEWNGRFLPFIINVWIQCVGFYLPRGWNVSAQIMIMKSAARHSSFGSFYSVFSSLCNLGNRIIFHVGRRMHLVSNQIN